ncbi:MAG: FtsX-like permease family protein, partial [Gemmatimonadetes bacterium]|nr:FtsX-like permease family protein [Gemmatimonadota bacterium]
QRVSFQRNADGGMLWREVVGVVRHQKHYGLNTVGREQVYATYAQVSVTTMFLVAQTEGDPIAFTSAIRNLIRTIDPDQPIADIVSMDGRVRHAVAEPRFNLTLLGAFAGVALVLATVGIYGVISYSVSQRSHEIGVRMALGAEARDVVGMVWKQGFGLVVFGLGIGTLAALGLTRAIRSLLFEVSAADPITYVAVGSLLAIVGATACLFPARRASRVGPVSVLTVE